MTRFDELSNERLPMGTDVGGYVLDGELGTGGMGIVYSATHPLIGKRAAVKVLRPELSNHPAAVERFMLEARAVNQIGHPNIVDIFAFGKLPDGRSYYVMDLLIGESLRNRIKRGGPLHVSEAANVIDQVAAALIAAHDKGIIHRDLKPDNVFMVTIPGRWPEVRILDWGILKLSSTQSAVSSGRYKTLAGSVMGTPVYMSPEQARASDSVDGRSDIYSFGAMTYEMLSGEPPFNKGTPIDTMLAHQEDPVPPLAQKCPALPEELVQLIEAMLAKEREQRPSLQAVRAVLKRLRSSKIPTMTAAGLSLPTSIPPSTTTTDVDDEHLTVPRQTTPAPRPTPMPSTPLSTPTTTLAGHLPPPGALRPSQPAIPQQLPSTPAPQASGSYGQPQPMLDVQYSQPMLEVHDSQVLDVQFGSLPRLEVQDSQVLDVQYGSQPMLDVQYSQPMPRASASHEAFAPDALAQHARPAAPRNRSIVLILIAGLIVATIGLILLLSR